MPGNLRKLGPWGQTVLANQLNRLLQLGTLIPFDEVSRTPPAMPKNHYASLKDVAAQAQVSFQTASKVLNGSDVRVAPETALRILAAADELEYRPNALARSLLQQSTATIGLVIANVTDAALARVAVGVQEEARLQGYAILLASLPTTETHGAEVVRMLFERRVDGIIVAPPQLEEDFEFGEIVRSTVPAVVLQHLPGGGVPFVGSDDRLAGQLATEHLLKLGHRSWGRSRARSGGGSCAAGCWAMRKHYARPAQS